MKEYKTAIYYALYSGKKWYFAIISQFPEDISLISLLMGSSLLLSCSVTSVPVLLYARNTEFIIIIKTKFFHLSLPD